MCGERLSERRLAQRERQAATTKMKLLKERSLRLGFS